MAAIAVAAKCQVANAVESISPFHPSIDLQHFHLLQPEIIMMGMMMSSFFRYFAERERECWDEERPTSY